MIKKKTDVDPDVLNTLCNIRHKNLSSVLKVTNEDGITYSYCDYSPGQSIQSFIDDGILFEENDAIKIAVMICDGLSLLHQKGIIHRDITASNIILSSDSNVKLIDYGIARTIKENATKDTTILGTVGYAAPEQFGFSQTDFRTDIYSIGVLLNIMITGKLPSEARCSGKIEKIISKCISINASDRFENVISLKKALLNQKSDETSLCDRLINNIPGFRSKKVIVNVLAGCLYFMSILVLVSMMSIFYDFGGIKAVIITSIINLLTFLPSFILVFNPFYLREKIPFIKNSSRKSKVILITFVSFALTLIGILLSSNYMPQ